MPCTGNDPELQPAKLSWATRNIVAMNEVLNQVAKSPFTQQIEGASLPRRFNQPTFSLYNGRIDPVEHVSHFNQKMAVHSKDETLMCKIFPSSLGPMAMR